MFWCCWVNTTRESAMAIRRRQSQLILSWNNFKQLASNWEEIIDIKRIDKCSVPYRYAWNSLNNTQNLGLGHQKQMYSLVPINLVGYLLKTDTNRLDTDRITSVYKKLIYICSIKESNWKTFTLSVYIYYRITKHLKEMSVSDKLSNVILSMRKIHYTIWFSETQKRALIKKKRINCQ